MSAVVEFKTVIAAAGLIPPDEIFEDGLIHRFDSDGRKGKKTGWYVFHGDGVAAGSFGCWKTGFQSTWCSQNANILSESQRQQFNERMELAKIQREVETKAKHLEAKTECAELWSKSKPCPEGGHPYLQTKGVKPYGINLQRDTLLVPLRVGKELVSIQFIGPDGNKRFKTGGQVQGAYFAIGKPRGTLVVCEGWATGASIHEATGHAVAVAFNAGNLKAVALAMKEKLPDARIVVAADDDAFGAENVGLLKAKEAAQVVGGFLAVPDFGNNRPDRATDFNDLHQVANIEVVKRCIENAQPVKIAESPKKICADDGVIFVNGADLVPEPINWLWHGWLAKGKLHILAGQPGLGKTTIAMSLAATVSTGGQFPDGFSCPAGNVLIWSGEDDPADTLLPRLLAAGANANRCYFVTGTKRDGEVQPFDPSTDMLQLEAKAMSIGGVALIVVDPVVSAVTGDSHKNTEVRRALQPLVDLTSRLGSALLGISHFSKGGVGTEPASRVIGSVAFTAVARVVLVAAKVKTIEGTDRRLLARAKSNIGPDDGGIEYTFDQIEVLKEIQASRIVWGDAIEGSARELLTDAPDDDDSKSELHNLLLKELSTDCWTPAKKVFETLAEAGFPAHKVRRAASKVGVKFQKGGMNKGWYWRLIGSPEQELNVEKTPEDYKIPEDYTEDHTSQNPVIFVTFGENMQSSGQPSQGEVFAESDDFEVF